MWIIEIRHPDGRKGYLSTGGVWYGLDSATQYSSHASAREAVANCTGSLRPYAVIVKV